MASELIVRDMYKGKYHMIHNPVARGRQPRYLVENTGEKPKGVTTILGNTLSKDLMDWAVSCCVEYLRTKLPVVTEEDLEVGANEYKVKRDSGAGTGSEAHLLVEQYLKGLKQDIPGASKEAQNAYNAFVKWYEEAKPKVVNVEEVIYSEKFKYAGTYDCMLEIDGKVILCDLKTTNASRKAPNGIYAEMFLQLGAYALAHEEQRQYEEANGGTELRKIDDLCVISAKKNGVLDICKASDLGLTVEECGEMFKRVINIHNFMLYATNQLGGK